MIALTDARMRRAERLIYLTQQLLQSPNRLFSLSTLVDETGAAKSTLSEDLDHIATAFSHSGIGEIQTMVGAAGGVRFVVQSSRKHIEEHMVDWMQALGQPHRILPGGFLYFSDLIFDPRWINPVGAIFASFLATRKVDAIATVETKGIPLAMATAQHLNVPVVMVRREHKVTEGPTVGINYVSGSAQRIQAMSLSKRSVHPGMRVAFIDDFMKAGATARGMENLMLEVGAKVVANGVLVATTDPQPKRVAEVFSLIELEWVDETERKIQLKPGTLLETFSHIKEGI